jgi:hypothetical protein
MAQQRSGFGFWTPISEAGEAARNLRKRQGRILVRERTLASHPCEIKEHSGFAPSADTAPGSEATVRPGGRAPEWAPRAARRLRPILVCDDTQLPEIGLRFTVTT